MWGVPLCQMAPPMLGLLSPARDRPLGLKGQLILVHEGN